MKALFLLKAMNKAPVFNFIFRSVRAMTPQSILNEDTEPVTGHREHMLIVDDEPQIRDIAEKMLTKSGYCVSVVPS